MVLEAYFTMKWIVALLAKPRFMLHNVQKDCLTLKRQLGCPHAFILHFNFQCGSLHSWAGPSTNNIITMQVVTDKTNKLKRNVHLGIIKLNLGKVVEINACNQSMCFNHLNCHCNLWAELSNNLFYLNFTGMYMKEIMLLY